MKRVLSICVLCLLVVTGVRAQKPTQPSWLRDVMLYWFWTQTMPKKMRILYFRANSHSLPYASLAEYSLSKNSCLYSCVFIAHPPLPQSPRQ